MPSVLTVNNAQKRFGRTRALAGANLALENGERLALLGPNGAGKTTLVRTIAGRVKLHQGDIALLGEALNGSPAAQRVRRRLGIVPQEIALYPLLTARENLEAFGAMHGLGGSALKERAKWALQWTGLADRAREPIRGFSGGMKRRLNIACGILHEPEVILLDEPTVGVDPQSRQRIWEMVDELCRRGASVLLTTHQLDEAQQVCDRIVIIDHGKDIAAGTFHELLRDTIGTQRRVTIELESAPPQALLQRGYQAGDDNTVLCTIDDVAEELPARLNEIKAAGGAVRDVHVQAPSLQAVFIHLTGRELRE
ncbi:MAG: ABC transporter ATP-binding protein [Planctomycetota bacterium]|nr:ABC transporter ATP-binding protein [Planctomycetota bacterium]